MLQNCITKWIDMDGEFTPVTWSTIVHVLAVIDSDSTVVNICGIITRYITHCIVLSVCVL